MKIAYIVNHLGQTGVNHVVSDLIKQMQHHGHDCRLFYFEDNTEPIAFPCATEKTSPVEGTIDFNAYDVVHTHGLKANLYVLRHKPRHGKARCVATLHCYVFQDFADLYGRIKGFLLGLIFLLSVLRHDKIVALSKDAVAYYSRWLSRRKLCDAYNTRDIDKSEDLTPDERKEILTFKGDDTLIGMNCVLILRKGIDVMLKAMRLLPDTYKLYIVGTGKEEALFKSMVDKDLAPRIRFAGARPRAHRYLSLYDIYALPSRSEGFPLALLEAADYGKRVVSSALPVVKECFTDDELITFPMPSETALAAAIQTAMTRPELCTNIKKRFDRDYSPESFYRRYMTIYGCNEYGE